MNFWATWCRPCVAELSYLQAVAQELQGSLPVRIWLISLDFPLEGPWVAAALPRRKGITLPAFWLEEKDPNSWIPHLNPNWDGAIPYIQADLNGSNHGTFTDTQSVLEFLGKPILRAFLLVSALLRRGRRQSRLQSTRLLPKNVDGKPLSLADCAEEFWVAYIGAIDDSPSDPKKGLKRYVAEAIEALLTGKPIPLPKRKLLAVA